jgi:hypothetical protein
MSKSEDQVVFTGYPPAMTPDRFLGVLRAFLSYLSGPSTGLSADDRARADGLLRALPRFAVPGADPQDDYAPRFGGPRPKVVTLCGSTRFYDAFQQANYDETMAGNIVLSVGFYPHAKAAHGHGEGVGHDSAEKVALDELHKRKIDMADEVLVVSDASGYYGDSTRSEIAYALAAGKPVRYRNIGDRV